MRPAARRPLAQHRRVRAHQVGVGRDEPETAVLRQQPNRELKEKRRRCPAGPGRPRGTARATSLYSRSVNFGPVRRVRHDEREAGREPAAGRAQLDLLHQVVFFGLPRRTARCKEHPGGPRERIDVVDVKPVEMQAFLARLNGRLHQVQDLNEQIDFGQIAGERVQVKAEKASLAPAFKTATGSLIARLLIGGHKPPRRRTRNVPQPQAGSIRRLLAADNGGAGHDSRLRLRCIHDGGRRVVLALFLLFRAAHIGAVDRADDVGVERGRS